MKFTKLYGSNLCSSECTIQVIDMHRLFDIRKTLGKTTQNYASKRRGKGINARGNQG